MSALIYASVAAMLASSALSVTTGTGYVVNHCSYSVALSAVPCEPGANGGFNAINEVLTPGQSWSQVWTQLHTSKQPDCGWAIKVKSLQGLDQSAVATLDWTQNLLQYEYTFNNDGTVWYDMSAVNGDPFGQDWGLNAVGGQAGVTNSAACSPMQIAYQNPNDNGASQSCTSDASITANLCKSESNGQTNAGSQSQAQAAPSSTTATTAPVSQANKEADVVHASTPAASPTTATHTSAVAQAPASSIQIVQEANVQAAPTTLVTHTTAAPSPANGDVHTDWVTVVETTVAYTTIGARHVHHPHHDQ